MTFLSVKAKAYVLYCNTKNDYKLEAYPLNNIKLYTIKYILLNKRLQFYYLLCLILFTYISD